MSRACRSSRRSIIETRPFDKSTLDTPLGSGPYKVGRFEVNRYIEYERVKDWWGANLPVCRGYYNYDVVRYEFYRDRDVAFEGFTGKNYLFREEFTSRIWATRYDFPAIKDGRVKREQVPDERPSGAQGWFINTRRDKFRDPRVREALINAFDFEWTNKTIMYGAYARTHSPFQNSDMMAKGPPSPEELKLLEPFRGKVPDEVFGQPYVPPVSDGSGQDRNMLRKAQQLLTRCRLRHQGRQADDAERRSCFGSNSCYEEPSLNPHHAPYIKNLGTLGIEASPRLVDAGAVPRQGGRFRFRHDDHALLDVDRRRATRCAPISPRRQPRPRARYNLAGIDNPAIDALIEKIIAAESRAELTVACRAFDRVFRAGRYWVPQWYNKTHRLAYWDMFDRPKNLPRYQIDASGVRRARHLVA